MATGPCLSREGGTVRVQRAAPHGPQARRALGALGFFPVSLSLYAGLDRYAPSPGPLTIEVEDGLTVGELLEALGLLPGEAKLLFVNHRAVELGQVLRSGDRVGAFPLIAGG